jgi:hypothetical protein
MHRALTEFELIATIPRKIWEGAAMDNLSADLSGRIGALELDRDVEDLVDGALEASAANTAIGPSSNVNCLPRTALCQ